MHVLVQHLGMGQHEAARAWSVWEPCAPGTDSRTLRAWRKRKTCFWHHGPMHPQFGPALVRQRDWLSCVEEVGTGGLAAGQGGPCQTD